MLLKPDKSFFLLFSIFFLSLLCVHAQNKGNNMGRDFWFALLENTSNPSKVSFAFSKKAAPNTLTYVTIKAGALTIRDSFYRKDTIISFTGSMVIPNPNQFINRSIHITSNHDISVYAMNNSGASTDIASISPSENIPYNPIYYVNTYRGDNTGNSSEFSIVAIDDSCRINILPSADTKTFNPRDTLITKLMRKGELYWLHSQDTQSFAGSKIWNSNGCKRFVVFEGAKCSRILNDVSCSGCDHLYNQTRPIQAQGKKYTTLPFKNLNGGYIVQIIASENNTSLFIDGIFTKTLSEREVYTYNNLSNTAACISADKKISVVQLMKSGMCNGNNSIGNPSSMTLLPDDQLTMNVQFSPPVTNNLNFSPAEFYIGLTCPRQNLSSIFINKKPLDTTKFIISCNNNAVGSISINSTTAYTIESTKGFNAYLYASGTDESYATELGGGYENNSTKLIMSPNESTTCDTFQQFLFNATSDSLATYLWNFGDGTSDTGVNVSKIYNKRGNFTVQLITRYSHLNGCKADSTNKELTIFSRPYFTLGKDTQLCLGSFFTVAPFTSPKSKYLWHNNSTAKTFNTGNPGTVFLTVTDTNNCSYSDTMQIRFINCDTNSIVIPNVFTPGNLDEMNDMLESRFTGFDQLEGYIYNRWGTIVYRFKYPENEFWNGGLHNNTNDPCPSGTYFYIYKFTNTSTHLTKDVNGTVELIR